MPIYEVTYSTTTRSNDELSFSDVVLIEAETHDELVKKVVDTLIRTLGPSGNYYVDSIGGNSYEPRPKMRNAKKIANDYQNIVSVINTLISKRDQGPLYQDHDIWRSSDLGRCRMWRGSAPFDFVP
jgi:hypothetical protein